MKAGRKRGALELELERLRLRLEEAEQTLRALAAGEVDSLIVEGPDGPRVYALEGSNQSYRVLVQEMNEGAATVTRDGTILYCNRRFAEVLGHPLEKMMGGILRDHVASQHLDDFDDLCRRGWKGESKGEVAIQRADGSQVPLYLSISALVDQEPVLCIIATDLTEHFRAQELRRSEALARRRATELQALFDAVPAAVLITRDASGKDVEGNDLCYELLRAPRGSEISFAPSPRGRFRVLKDGVALPSEAFPIRVAASQGVEVRNFELALEFEDGSVRHILGNATPLRDDQGRANGAVAAFIDITERRKVEEALREGDQRKTDFLAVLSHELRNPLAPIRNSVFTLDQVPPGSDAARRAREVLHRQTEHLTRLVDDLLDINRIAHGKIDLQLASLDACEVVRRSCDDMRAVFEERGLEIELTLPESSIWVEADESRLAQMVENLLGNALKFTPRGGQVRVEVAVRDGECEIAVRDTGIGIDPGDVGRIFEPFVQSGRTRSQGLGIGLALVRELALKHRGAVRARSAGAGRGAEFVLTLPLGQRATEPVARGSGRRRSTGLSVLIIEDNEDAGASLVDVLELLEHRVELVSTGRAGVDAACARMPDVLICDLGLPDMDGRQVIRALRKLPSARGLFGIALTGLAQPQDRQDALSAGFDAHLAKPASIDQLEALLAEAARRQGGHRDSAPDWPGPAPSRTPVG
jgi:PAS domain S-box-containing protein